MDRGALWGVVILLANLVGDCYAQKSHVIDSIARAVKSSTGYKRIDATNALAYEYLSYSYQQSTAYATQALTLSRRQGYARGAALAHIILAVNEYNGGKNSIAIVKLADIAQRIRGKSMNDLEGFARTHQSGAYLALGQLDSAQWALAAADSLLHDGLHPDYLSFYYLMKSEYHRQRREDAAQLDFLKKCWRMRLRLPHPKLAFPGDRLATYYMKEKRYDSAEYYIRTIYHSLDSDTVENEEISLVYKLKGLLDIEQGNYETGLTLLNRTREFYRKNESTFDLVELSLTIGIILADLNSYESSLNNYLEGLQLARRSKFHLQECQINFRIAWVYYMLRQDKLSNEYCQTASLLAHQYGFLEEEGYVFNLLGLLSQRQGRLAEAHDDFTRSLTIRQRLGDPYRIASTLLNLGQLHEARGELQKALDLELQSLTLETNIGHQWGMAVAAQSIGQLLVKKSELSRASHYLDLADSLARKIRALDILIDVYHWRREMLLAAHQYERAMVYSKRYEALKDSIFNQNLATRMSALQYDFRLNQQAKELENTVQQRDIARLNESRERFQKIIGFVAFLMAAVIGLFTYSNYKKIKRLNQAIAESSLEIRAKSAALKETNEELLTLNQDLAGKNEEIITQNESLLVIQRELASQKELLTEQNQQLEEAKRVIQKQNEQNISRNEQLELEVQNRTRELLEYNQQLEQFAFIASHNLRAPVARILGLGNLLALTKRNAIDQPTITNGLIQSAHELDRIVKDLSLILDIKKNTSDARIEIVLEDQLRDITNHLAAEISETEAIIRSDFTAAPVIKTVRPYLDSILLNLIQNAIKYRRPGVAPIISLNSSIRDGWFMLTICDNGMGIDLKQYGNQIFKLYKRFHLHVEGKGLGLYLVKTQMAALNGKIEWKSAVDEGSTFTLFFPHKTES